MMNTFSNAMTMLVIIMIKIIVENENDIILHIDSYENLKFYHLVREAGLHRKDWQGTRHWLFQGFLQSMKNYITYILGYLVKR